MPHYNCYYCGTKLLAQRDEINTLDKYICNGCGVSFKPFEVEIDKLPATFEKLRELDKENDISLREQPEDIKYMGKRWPLRIWVREVEGLKLTTFAYYSKPESAIRDAFWYLGKIGKLSV